MARIRTVKPEFWTDERLTECSLSARLMFIGMLNFADDNGNLAYSAKRLKMQIFPADMIDTQPLLNELLTHGVLIEYSVSGEKFINIKGFRKHQLINRPSATKIPGIELSDDSVSPQLQLTDGVEWSGVDGKEEIDKSILSPAKLPDCPHESLIDLYAQHLPMLPQPRKSLWRKGKNAPALKARWSWVMTECYETGVRKGQRMATNQEEGIGWFGRFFAYVAQSSWLTGGDGKWTADLIWLVNLSNFEKVLQGNYDNKKAVA